MQLIIIKINFDFHVKSISLMYFFTISELNKYFFTYQHIFHVIQIYEIYVNLINVINYPQKAGFTFFFLFFFFFVITIVNI